MTDQVKQELNTRKERLARILGRRLELPARGTPAPLTEERRAYLLDEAYSLYWNELEWEHITEEEQIDGGPLAELTFPGLLAYVRGLLLEETMPDALAPAEPRPEVVQDILLFLARRVVELRAEPREEEDAEQRRMEAAITSRLLDLVLALLYDLSPADLERLETAGA